MGIQLSHTLGGVCMEVFFTLNTWRAQNFGIFFVFFIVFAVMPLCQSFPLLFFSPSWYALKLYGYVFYLEFLKNLWLGSVWKNHYMLLHVVNNYKYYMQSICYMVYCMLLHVALVPSTTEKYSFEIIFPWVLSWTNISDVRWHVFLIGFNQRHI